MKTKTIDNGNVEVAAEHTQNKKFVVLHISNTTNGGYSHLKPLEAVVIGKALIEEAMQCFEFPEAMSIVRDLRDFIEGGPVDEKGNVIELGKPDKLTVTFVGDRGVRLSDGRWIDIEPKPTRRVE